MKVSVFGALSPIGQELVEDLLFRGYEVIALVTDPSQVPAAWGRDVELVTGQITESVKAALSESSEAGFHGGA